MGVGENLVDELVVVKTTGRRVAALGRRRCARRQRHPLAGAQVEAHHVHGAVGRLALVADSGHGLPVRDKEVELVVVVQRDEVVQLPRPALWQRQYLTHAGESHGVSRLMRIKQKRKVRRTRSSSATSGRRTNPERWLPAARLGPGALAYAQETRG